MNVLTEFEPGTITDLKIGVDGNDRRLVGTVDFDLAMDIANSEPPVRRGLVGSENGAIDLEPVSGFSLFGGKAHRTMHSDVAPGTPCFNHVSVAVADGEQWQWIKMSVSGGEFEGLACIGINTETRQAILVSL